MYTLTLFFGLSRFVWRACTIVNLNSIQYQLSMESFGRSGMKSCVDRLFVHLLESSYLFLLLRLLVVLAIKGCVDVNPNRLDSTRPMRGCRNERGWFRSSSTVLSCSWCCCRIINGYAWEPSEAATSSAIDRHVRRQREIPS